MSRPRRILLLPALGVLATLLLAAPAAALPAFSSADSTWDQLLEPLFRLGRMLTPEGWAFGSDSHPTPEPWSPAGLFAPEGWLIDPNGLVIPLPPCQGACTPPNV